MPAVIACPKCKTKYQLPDTMLGKPIKCKSCGAAFQAKAAVAKSAAPEPATTRPAGVQPSTAELARLGLDGPLRKQPDVFAGVAPPPRKGPDLLGNLAADPGFAEHEFKKKAGQEPSPTDAQDAMDAILRNPYLPGNEGGRSRKKDLPPVDLKSYFVPRIGMWIVLVCWVGLLAIGTCGTLFFLSVRVAPDMVKSIAESMGEAFLSILAIGAFGATIIAGAAAVLTPIGQFLCAFSPNSDEKKFAILAISALAISFTLSIVSAILGVFASQAGTGDVGDTVKAATGLLQLGTFFTCYALVLANMFFFITYFRAVGKNIRANDVVESAKIAMILWITSICVAVISIIGLSILAAVGSASKEYVGNVIEISALINVFLGFMVMGSLVLMVKRTLSKTSG